MEHHKKKEKKTNPESRPPTGQKLTRHVTIGAVNAGLLVISYSVSPMEITNRPPSQPLLKDMGNGWLGKQY
jgi:hypothetical protein